MSRVENNALFVAKREREREFVSSSVLPPELLFLRFVLLLRKVGSILIRRRNSQKAFVLSSFFSNNFIPPKNRSKK